jgi:hypothetical protein
LAKDEDVCCDVSAAANIRFVMASGAGVSIGSGDTVEIAGEDQRLMWIGQRSARPFSERTACAFLRCPHGVEQRTSIIDQGGDGHLVFLTILHVLGNGNFAADAFILSQCHGDEEQRQTQDYPRSAIKKFSHPVLLCCYLHCVHVAFT